MSDSENTCVLMIFAKQPVAGFAKTRLGSSIGHHNAACLYQAFLTDFARRFDPLSSNIWFDVCWVYTPNEEMFPKLISGKQGTHNNGQAVSSSGRSTTFFVGYEGQGLAEQQILQLDWARTLGYKKVIIIGTDVPNLEYAIVKDALKLLNSYDIVIGPTNDGGYFLLGIKGFWDVLEGIDINTNHVRLDIISKATAKGKKIAELNMMVDIDTLDDVEEFIDLMLGSSAVVCPATWATLQDIGLLTGKPKNFGG